MTNSLGTKLKWVKTCVQFGVIGLQFFIFFYLKKKLNLEPILKIPKSGLDFGLLQKYSCPLFC